MEVNSIAHIFLTASNYKRSREFYRELLPFLGLKPVIDTEVPLADFESGLARLEGRKVFGKIIVTF